MHDIRTGICPLCDHREIVQRVATESTGKTSYEVKMAVTHGEKESWIDHRLNHPIGTLSLYVCRSCGYVQWFAKDPAMIPIDGPTHGTSLIRGPEKQLYR